jgi:hypothetical protein
MDLSSIFEMVVLSSAMGSMVAVLILGVKWLLKSKTQCLLAVLYMVSACHKACCSHGF